MSATALLFGSILFGGIFSPKDPCTWDHWLQGKTKIQTGRFSDGACFVSLGPRFVPKDLIYRSFVLSSEGEFLIFESYDSDESPTSVGSRVFFLPPVESPPDFSLSLNQDELNLLLINGETLRFDLDSFSVKAYSGGRMEFSPEVDRRDIGGLIAFESHSGVFDVGARFSGVPQDNSRAVTYWRQNKQLCVVPNRKLFDYSDPEETRWKIKSAADVSSIKKAYCDISR